MADPVQNEDYGSGYIKRKARVDQMWRQLKQNIEQVYERKGLISKKERMEICSELLPVVYNYCLSSATAEATEELYCRVKDHLETYIVTLKQDQVDLMDEEVLKFYTKQLEDYQRSSEVLATIFTYLTRLHSCKLLPDGESSKPEIYQLALSIWRDYIYKPLFQQHAWFIVSHKMVPEERGMVRIKNSRKQTNGYYKAEQMMLDEERRIKVYVYESTLALGQLIFGNNLKMFYNEFKRLIRDGEIEDLAIMYKLVLRIPNGLEEVNKYLETNITTKGLAAINSCYELSLNNPKLYVQTILNIHSRYNSIVLMAFESNPVFVSTLDKACVKFINSNNVAKRVPKMYKSPELLAEYCDLLLKKSSKNFEAEELEATLNEVMIMLKYIEDKDVFERFYSKMLANRLVQNISVSDDAETDMISKLKQDCGFEYTSKMQRMFQDIKVSKDLNDQFMNHLNCSNEPLDLDCSIQVIRSRYWPFKSHQRFTLPRELRSCVSQFTAFYSSHHCDRNLNWLHHLSSGEIVTNCFKRSYTLQASTFQIAVLLQFNNTDSLLISQLQELTDIPQDTLIQVVQILLQYKLLISDDGDEISSDSRVNLFLGYEYKKLKVNINLPMKTEAKLYQDLTEIEENRITLIQTAIVKIMKEKNTCKHQQLLTEVTNYLAPQFKPDVPTIKKCIDILIEKEYLKGIDGQENTYSYVS